MEAKRFSISSFHVTSRIGSLLWLYKLVSGYGEKWHWALGWLFALLFSFSLVFSSSVCKFDFAERKIQDVVQTKIFIEEYLEPFKPCLCGNVDETQPIRAMNRCEALVHSLSVAAFMRPEPKPADTLTKFFIFLLTILAPLQAALLALAIRRKFMR
jgi:hypothetical protein